MGGWVSSSGWQVSWHEWVDVQQLRSHGPMGPQLQPTHPSTRGKPTHPAAQPTLMPDPNQIYSPAAHLASASTAGRGMKRKMEKRLKRSMATARSSLQARRGAELVAPGPEGRGAGEEQTGPACCTQRLGAGIPGRALLLLIPYPHPPAHPPHRSHPAV